MPFGGISDENRCAPVCLAGTFRSRGFAPPQRLDPLVTSWLCFTPHPPVGFRPPEPFPRDQPWRLSAPDALLPSDDTPRCGRTRSECLIPASEPCSGRASDTRPGGFSAGRAAALLAFPPFEVYRNPTDGPKSSPFALHPDVFRPEVNRGRSHRGLRPRVFTRSGLGAAPESRSNLHEVFHLVRFRTPAVHSASGCSGRRTSLRRGLRSHRPSPRANAKRLPARPLFRDWAESFSVPKPQGHPSTTVSLLDPTLL